MKSMNNISSSSKVIVVGTSGCGKTTLAGKLAKKFDLTDIELDELFWKPGWKTSSHEEFSQKIESKLSESSGWVIHGNYSKTRDLYWEKGTHLIWLDYSFFRIFYRVVTRTVRRVMKRETVCNGNREGFVQSFMSKDSIILWMLKTYKRRKRQYNDLIRSDKVSHLKVLRFTRPSQIDLF